MDNARMAAPSEHRPPAIGAVHRRPSSTAAQQSTTVHRPLTSSNAIQPPLAYTAVFHRRHHPRLCSVVSALSGPAALSAPLVVPAVLSAVLAGGPLPVRCRAGWRTAPCPVPCWPADRSLTGAMRGACPSSRQRASRVADPLPSSPAAELPHQRQQAPLEAPLGKGVARPPLDR